MNKILKVVKKWYLCYSLLNDLERGLLWKKEILFP